jgi:DNA-binding XRE family transcriptional regulator
MTTTSRPYFERAITLKAQDKGRNVGHKKFSELRATMSAERRARAAERKKAMLTDLPLQELRLARELTQATLAETMECGQDEISKLERRADMLVSTLRRYVEAMGGRLDIVATFPAARFASQISGSSLNRGTQ